MSEHPSTGGTPGPDDVPLPEMPTSGPAPSTNSPGVNPGDPTARRGPLLGLKEASRACGVSLNTIRRRKDALVAAGARADETGWQIPVSALVATGLMDRVTPSPGVATRPGTGREPSVQNPVSTGGNGEEVAALRERVQRLEHDLEVERVERRAAERVLAVAEESLERADRALRALEARSAPSPDEMVQHSSVSPDQSQPATTDRPGPAGQDQAWPAAPGPRVSRRRWWQRRSAG